MKIESLISDRTLAQMGLIELNYHKQNIASCLLGPQGQDDRMKKVLKETSSAIDRALTDRREAEPYQEQYY